jgi:hypothetical protein
MDCCRGKFHKSWESPPLVSDPTAYLHHLLGDHQSATNTALKGKMEKMSYADLGSPLTFITANHQSATNTAMERENRKDICSEPV